MNKSVIIIGSGLGGLQCGYILAKNGFDVTVLEHDSVVGGCLQTFRRGKALFDTGFHYVGGLGEGQSLHGLFRYFDLLDLPWQPLDVDCFDEVVIGNRSFPFACGHQNFVERLADFFPKERQNLAKYAEFLRQVGEHIYDSFLPRESSDFYSTSLFARSAHEFLTETISDPLLQKVLSGTSLKMELCAETLPLYVFAQINNSFIQSAWRLRGGGSLIAVRLAEKIREFGGKIRVHSTVTKMVEENGRIAKVIVNGGETLTADYVVSNAHPATTLALVDESRCLRRIYRNRITNLRNSFGMFTANIRLKTNELPYQNRNIFVHADDADLWHFQSSEKVKSVLVNFAPPTDGSDFAPSIDLLTPMRWHEVEQWSDCRVGHRGESYVDFKDNRVEQCLGLVEKRLPELRNAIDRVFTSTPLSYQSYTLTHQGSAYGICKDFNNPMATVLTPRTPIENLLLTGQNLNLHGILGVSMTSIFTCAELLGMDFLVKEIRK